MTEGNMGMEDDEEEQENYIGRTVKKFFLGFGYFHGKVIAFNRAHKFYKVKYDDGDREELDVKELKEVLVDNQQPLLSAAKPRSSRRGRKRRRDSTDKDGATLARRSTEVEEGLYDNAPGKNSSRKEIAEQFSPFKLEEVRVLNAQTQEIYRQLRGDRNAEGKDGRRQGNELLLEPLVPVCLVDAFEKSMKQAGSAFEDHEEDEERRAGACGHPVPPVDTTPPCRLKRTRVSPTSDMYLQQMPSVRQAEIAASNEEVGTVKVEEEPLTIADPALPPVATEADSPYWDLDNKNSDTEKGGREGPKEKTQFGTFWLSLPPSSRSLGALDDCVAEFFEVYSMLRSFSSMIFLSPFSLEEFAYALISTDVCSLIDCVHLSLMQTLRRQLERLSKSGSKSSTFTLRLSDWSLLDFMTWPSFLTGYMLTQGFCFDAGHSDLKAGITAGEYYKLPVRTKLVILSFLCDKVLDTEEARAELARRIILENDPETMESRVFAQKKQVKDSIPDVVDADHERPSTVKDEVSAQGAVQLTLSSSPSAASSIRVGRHLDEDGNLDECVLCAMDGNLICCDGCPAAYHSRCVGVSKQGLPPGDWFCPECRADKHDPRGAGISKGIRGGELLAIGPDSQMFYTICGYVLISESGPGGQVMHRYYSTRDLPTIIELLEAAGPSYSHVEDAARQLCQVGLRRKMAIDATSKPSAVEAPPSSDSSPEKEPGRHDVQNPSSSLAGGELPVKIEKPVPSSDSRTFDKTVKSHVAISYQSTTANCESFPSPLFFPPNDQYEENHSRHVIDLNQTNESSGGDCILSVEKALPSFDPIVAELSRTSEILTSDLSSAFANCETLRTAVSCDRNGGQEEQQDLHVTGEDEKKSEVLGDEPKKPGHDELHYNVMDNFVISDLKNIRRQDTFDHPKDVIPHSITCDSKGKVTVEVDSSTGGRAVPGVNCTPMNASGNVEEVISLGTAQPVCNGDFTVKTIYDCSGGPVSKQRDVCTSLVKSAVAQSGTFEKEVDYFSTVTQVNACSYSNKYANCDLVATSAFNLAVMAGGLDDLVDDKSGPMKKPKPSSVADQLRAFTQACSHFYWPSVKKRAKDVPKEKCGWCINCRSVGRRGCLLTQVAGQIAGGAALVVGGIRPTKGGPGHFPAVAAYILYMEEHLHGLLVGPWEFRGHRKKWRKQVEQANSLKDIKLALLQMESSMRKVVLSSDWDKVEEDAPESIASSGVIISTTAASTGKKAAPTKKRGRPHVVTKTPSITSYDGSCFGVKWWRGGRLSRKVYNWESLPRIALRRAGRQGGFKEIPELVYSRSLDLPRRSRRLAWRTRLEKISSIAHVAVEVRYLDTFVKWNDIISPLEASTTHNVKTPAESDPAFHKADIRTKKEENGVVKYLLGFPADTDDKTDAEQQQEVASKGVGSSVEKPGSKKNHATLKIDENAVWVTESQVPLFVLKAFMEKTRVENQSEMPKSLKKGKLKGPNHQKKLSFWKILCSPRLSGALETKKRLPGWVCGHCKLNGSESKRVRCQRCSGDFHRSCARLDGVNGQEKFLVCNSCIQVRLGQRMRKPSYKMLVMQAELSNGEPNEVLVASMDGSSAGGVKLRLKKGDRADSTSPPDFELFGRKKKKKRLLSMPTPSQLNSDYPWMEEKQGKRKKMKKKKGFTTVFPCQYEGDPNLVAKEKKKKKATLTVEETDPPQLKKRRGRKKKIVSLVPSQAEPSQERRTSGRIRNSISPNTAISLSLSSYQNSTRGNQKHKLDNDFTQPETAISTRKRRALMKDTLAAAGNAAENDYGEDLVAIKPSLKRKRLKVIFDGLELAGTDRNDSVGLEDGPRKRKSANGLDFGSRSSRSELDIQKFRRERVVFEDQVVLDVEKLANCGICSEPYACGQVYVSCEYCEGWYHGVAIGLRPGDAGHLVGYKCHRCRKCRAPVCPIRQNNPGVKTRRRGTIDHGEVIDAENVKRTGQFDGVNLQSSWFNSPDKEFSAFSDSKALPDFVSATNQAEEALAADGSNFGHDVLSHDFDMSDLVLAGGSQVQLNPLSGDQQVNVWANSDASQLGLPAFSVSQADLSAQGAPSLSFTELLASEDDLFAGVTGAGLVLSAEWSGEGPDAIGPLQPSGMTLNARGGNFMPLFNANRNMSAPNLLLAGVKIPATEISTKAVMDNYSSLVAANGNLSISGAHVPPPKTLADITTNAAIDGYSSLADSNGNVCQTTLPSEQFGNNSYHLQSEPLPVMNGISGNIMNMDGPSAASR